MAKKGRYQAVTGRHKQPVENAADREVANLSVPNVGDAGGAGRTLFWGPGC
jgi:hypothetical protein